MPRGRPFQPGNRQGRGRPRGSRNKTTEICQQLLAENAELLTRKYIVMAAKGDAAAMRVCMDRLMPLRRAQPVRFRMGGVGAAAEISQALQTILSEVAAGRLTPEEGQQVSSLLEMRRRALETEAIEQRLAALEAERAQANQEES